VTYHHMTLAGSKNSEVIYGVYAILPYSKNYTGLIFLRRALL